MDFSSFIVRPNDEVDGSFHSASKCHIGSSCNHQQGGTPMKDVTVIGLDLAKRVFQVHGVDQHGHVTVQKRLTRSEVLPWFNRLEPCLVGIEACATAHYWARELGKLGHQVKLIPPAYVKPYVRRQKNDRADAAAICEAVSRPSMRFATAKTIEQQAVQILHRSRELACPTAHPIDKCFAGAFGRTRADISAWQCRHAKSDCRSAGDGGCRYSGLRPASLILAD